MSHHDEYSEDDLDYAAGLLEDRPIGFTMKGSGIFEGLDPFVEAEEAKYLREFVEQALWRTRFDSELFRECAKGVDQRIMNATEYLIRAVDQDLPEPLEERIALVAACGFWKYLECNPANVHLSNQLTVAYRTRLKPAMFNPK